MLNLQSRHLPRQHMVLDKLFIHRMFPTINRFIQKFLLLEHSKNRVIPQEELS